MKKENRGNTVITRGVAKVFKYNAGVESIVDGNTVQLPFISEYKGERKTAMEYIWYTKDGKGGFNKRGIFVSGHGEYGVPTLFDSDVYITLQDIFLQKKTKNGICELQPIKNMLNDYLNIEFNITELAREMGYSLPINNNVRDNLKKSIETLLATTMFSLYEGGIYDIEKKQYITNKTVGYHLLENYADEQIKDKNGESISDVTHIRLSEFTYLQILNDYKLYYNKNKYRKPRNRISRKIYHMALQWKGKNDFAYANINTLMEKIPMIEQKNKYKKRYIKNALKALNKTGIVKINIDKNDLVYFDFRKNDEINSYKDKYNKYKEIENKLFEYGFSIIEVNEMLDIQRIRHIQALLRYMDYQKVMNPKKYFMKCYKQILSNELNIDKKFYNEEI